MSLLTGGSFKTINPEDIVTRKSTLNQLVDIVQEDISGSATRKSYQVWVTGGIGPGVTSSLFQTVYDQDFTLQTANPMFDLTFGLYYSGSTVQTAKTGEDSSGQLLFSSQSLMMRDKVDIYKQFAANLIGNSTNAFYAPYGSTGSNDQINEALFVCFKRLFARDSIKKETFAVKMYRSGSASLSGTLNAGLGVSRANIGLTSLSGSAIFTDMGASSNQRRTFGGDVGNIVNSANTSETVGLIFYDKGTVVLDMAKIFSGSEKMSGSIDAMSTATTIAGASIAAGLTVLGSSAGNSNAKFIPDFVVSGSIDDVIDHVASCRFQSGSLTAMTFQNNTDINSTVVFCNASADEFNFSSNPTYVDSTGRIRVIELGQEDRQSAFSFVTTIGLHDQYGNLLAVGKLSRPVEKNNEKQLSVRLRIDFFKQKRIKTTK